MACGYWFFIEKENRTILIDIHFVYISEANETFAEKREGKFYFTKSCVVYRSMIYRTLIRITRMKNPYVIDLWALFTQVNALYF